MPLILIPIVFIVVLLSAWILSRYLLSRRLHPHELTKQYADLLEKSPLSHSITLTKGGKKEPMWIAGSYKERPFLMTVVTLFKNRSSEQTLKIHGYLSALRISIPARVIGHEDVVVYRKADSFNFNQGTLLEVAGGNNCDKLSPKEEATMVQFIGEYGAFRYRTRTDISPLVVPNGVWVDQKMILSHDRFHSKTSLDEVFSILDGLHHVADLLEQP